jgi:hypothetical protein
LHALFLILGIALTAFGLFWFVGGLQGGYIGADLLLYVGLFATLAGFGLIMLALYDKVKQRSLRQA